MPHNRTLQRKVQQNSIGNQLKVGKSQMQITYIPTLFSFPPQNQRKSLPNSALYFLTFWILLHSWKAKSNMYLCLSFVHPFCFANLWQPKLPECKAVFQLRPYTNRYVFMLFFWGSQTAVIFILLLSSAK